MDHETSVECPHYHGLMNILVFTSLFPNNVWPWHGIFIKERMAHFTRDGKSKIQVMAPVPYFPPLRISRRWSFSQVAHTEKIDGVQVYHPRYLMIPKVGMMFQGLFMFLALVPIMKKVQREFNFDIIDSHYAYPDGFAAVLLGHLLRKPVVISVRGSDVNLFSTFPVIRKFLRFTFQRANHIIAVSKALKEVILGMNISEEKIVVIPNGIDGDKFRPVPTREAKQKLQIQGHPVLLSVGNLNPNKGFDILIRTVKILVERGSQKDIHLVIVGEGDSRASLQELVRSLGLEEHVSFVGSVLHQDLPLWYSAADLFCLASGREGWPNVLLEAMACGKPVVATSVGGIPEIVTSNQLGFLVQRNEKDFANGISQALLKAWNAESIRQYAQTHTWDRVTNSLENVFHAVRVQYHRKDSPGQRVR